MGIPVCVVAVPGCLKVFIKLFVADVVCVSLCVDVRSGIVDIGFVPYVNSSAVLTCPSNPCAIPHLSFMYRIVPSGVVSEFTGAKRFLA